MTRDQEVHVPAFKVNAVDTSGAGDAFIGCFPIIMFKAVMLKPL